MTKSELRTEAAAARAIAAATGRQASTSLAALANALPDTSVVAGYHPMGDELDPRPLMAALAKRGARLCLPITPPRASDEPLSFRAWTPGDPLIRSGFGVLEPTGDTPNLEPDLLLVPLLAYDDAGGRLGWGAGHYDRTLRQLRSRRRVTAVGSPTLPRDAPICRWSRTTSPSTAF
jgi:5-formyltetrahydrofolate cyclo-ligase